MKQEKLNSEILTLINDFILENEIEVDNKIDFDTRLIGSSSIFDSMELVQFIVEVENLLDEKFNIELQLASEKAMSRRTSPFLSINTMSKYIIDECQ